MDPSRRSFNIELVLKMPLIPGMVDEVCELLASHLMLQTSI